MRFLKESFAAELNGYDGDNIQYIVEAVRRKQDSNTDRNSTSFWTETRPYPPDTVSPRTLSGSLDRQRRQNDSSAVAFADDLDASSFDGVDLLTIGRTELLTSKNGSDIVDTYAVTGILMTEDMGSETSSYSSPADTTVDSGAVLTGEFSAPRVRQAVTQFVRMDVVSEEEEEEEEEREAEENWNKTADYYFRRYSYADRLLEIAHIFHFASIAILGIFVIQVKNVYAIEDSLMSHSLGLRESVTKVDQTQMGYTRTSFDFEEKNSIYCSIFFNLSN